MAAARLLVDRLGFTSVKSLSPGERTNHQGLLCRLSAPVHRCRWWKTVICMNIRPDSLYLEPHGFLDPALEPQSLDAVITPMVDPRTCQRLGHLD